MKNIYNGLKMKTSLYRVIYVSQLLGDHSRLAFVSNAPLFLLHPLQQTFSHFAAHIAWIHYSASCARRHRWMIHADNKCATCCRSRMTWRHAGQGRRKRCKRRCGQSTPWSGRGRRSGNTPATAPSISLLPSRLTA